MDPRIDDLVAGVADLKATMEARLRAIEATLKAMQGLPADTRTFSLPNDHGCPKCYLKYLCTCSDAVLMPNVAPVGKYKCTACGQYRCTCVLWE